MFRMVPIQEPAYAARWLLRDSWKETRFYFLTQLVVLCSVLCFVFCLKQNKQHKTNTHILTHTLTVYSYEFPLKGREGGPVQNFDNKDLSNGD